MRPKIFSHIFCFLLFTSFLQAETYRQVIERVDHALALKSAEQLEKAAGYMAEAAKGRNLPALDAHLNAAYLKDTPTMILHFPIAPGTPTEPLPMGTKEQWNGDVTLSYPLFTGFAVTAAIDKAEYEKQKAHLKRLDLQRNLYLQATRLYTAAYATERILEAKKKAKDAIEAAYRKARGLYDNGLLPPADLYNIEARKFAIEADITETKSQKRQLLNRLSWLLDTPVERVEAPTLSSDTMEKASIVDTAMHEREDILALKTALKIGAAEEKLAKSRYYPTLMLAAAVKRQGDTPALDGDGFTNADRSYVGAQANWNLFSGFADQNRIEAARAGILAAKLQLNDYEKRVVMEIDNAFEKLGTLRSKLLSAKMEIKAREEYFKLTEGRFENQLASADELSRAIADLAAARATKAVLESEIFSQWATICLMGGLKNFKKRFLEIQ